MLSAIKDLPLPDKKTFFQDRRNIAATESYLRRALEALLDLGRHILVKGFGYPATEYRDIARTLRDKALLAEKEGDLLEKMAGYRNRMVHFYQEISADELYELASEHLEEIEQVLKGLIQWLKEHKDMMDEGL